MITLLHVRVSPKILTFEYYKVVKDMKGITDEKSRKKAVVIEMKTLKRFDEQIEDLFDAIIAESRKEERSVSWETLKKRLKKKGKL